MQILFTWNPIWRKQNKTSSQSLKMPSHLKLWITYSPTDRGNCAEVLSHLKHKSSMNHKESLKSISRASLDQHQNVTRNARRNANIRKQILLNEDQIRHKNAQQKYLESLSSNGMNRKQLVSIAVITAILDFADWFIDHAFKLVSIAKKLNYKKIVSITIFFQFQKLVLIAKLFVEDLD